MPMLTLFSGSHSMRLLLILLLFLAGARTQAEITGTGTDGALASTGLTATSACSLPCDVCNTTVPSGSNRMGLFSAGIHTSSIFASETLTVGGNSATKPGSCRRPREYKQRRVSVNHADSNREWQPVLPLRGDRQRPAFLTGCHRRRRSCC